ncbi:MAG: YdeI/OmpD-associated family protein [Sphingobacteriia bacterium]|nr:YdeI/OmpD-associated family protein [Sphingobacteriia bacterium]
MGKKLIAEGVLHKVPDDMKKALNTDADILERWNKLTPIQRNEWICWVTIVKKTETRAEHIHRMREELIEGKRQPCCWPGCPHRRPSAKKWFNKLDK